jgi:hypothetical protein
MRMFAKMSEKYFKTEYDKILLKNICLISEVIDFALARERPVHRTGYIGCK